MTHGMERRAVSCGRAAERLAVPRRSRPMATSTRKPQPPKTLPVRKDAAVKVKGGKRTTVKDANDKF